VKKITIWVKPGSKKGPLVEADEDGELVVYVRERPVDGKANDAAIELLAKYLEVPRSHVQLESGRTSKHKKFIISS